LKFFDVSSDTSIQSFPRPPVGGVNFREPVTGNVSKRLLSSGLIGYSGKKRLFLFNETSISWVIIIILLKY